MCPSKRSCSRRKLFVICAASAALLTPLTGISAGFPEKSIKFVVPFPPGSGTDTAARVFAKAIADAAGQAVIVENKPGANGFIAVQSVLSAPADGYTVLIGSNSTLSANAATFRKLPYDPVTDFAPISLILDAPVLLVVPPNSPYKTLADLVTDAKKRPGALNYGTGSVSYTLYAEWLNQMTGIKAVPINYKGSGDVVSATMANNVDFAIVDGSSALPLVKSGRLRALVQPAANRSPLLPEVPSAAEAGIASFNAVTWVAATAHAKTPPSIVQRLAELFAKAGTSPDVKQYYANQFVTLRMEGPSSLQEFQRDEIERWKALASSVGLELQ